MKPNLTFAEKDAFAIAVSRVEGLARNKEQAALFANFDRSKTPISEQIKTLYKRYSVAV
jgi:hypothetical protein